MNKLAGQRKTEAGLVKLRYFVGMTNEEAAEALGISSAPPSTTGPTLAPGFTGR